MTKKPILITPGEPLGIGPDIVIQFSQKKWPYPYKIIADPLLMLARAEQLNLKFNTAHVLPVKMSKRYVLQCLQLATKLCLEKKAAALVTGPVNKKMINDTGVKFQGHTQYLAKLTHTKDVTMFFESPHLKLALVTDHLPRSQVSAKVTQKRLISVIKMLNINLKRYFKINLPYIAVCGLNPHAGEGGILGEEENRIIIPAINFLQKEDIHVVGPFSADAFFAYLC
jgi:4-hydroxythreonine-4-phosphate dehydrogenase